MTECTHPRSRVIDSRPWDYVNHCNPRVYAPFAVQGYIIRRRKCKECGARFSTYEVREEAMIAMKKATRMFAEITRFIETTNEPGGE